MSLSTEAVGRASMSPSHTHFYSHVPLPLPALNISFLSSQERLGNWGPRGKAEISASYWTCSLPLLFRHRHYKNVVCWLNRFVSLISPSSVKSFCHLPCVFCIFQRIASFQQHPLSSHWKWKHVLGRNFPLSRPSFPRWGLGTPACNAVFLSTAVWHFWASTMSGIQSL